MGLDGDEKGVGVRGGALWPNCGSDEGRGEGSEEGRGEGSEEGREERSEEKSEEGSEEGRK